MGRTTWITGVAGVLAATAALASAPAHALDVYVQVAPQPYYQPYHQPQYYNYQQPRYVYGASSYGYNNGHHYGQRRRDLDRDGIPDRYDHDLDNDGRPNSRDRDRDGDGVPNRYDRRPDNRYRY